MKRFGVPKRCAALDFTFGSVGAIGILILAGCLVSAFSRPAAPAPTQGLDAVTAALDTLRQGRGAFVDAMRRGSMRDLRQVAEARSRAMDCLSMELENMSLLRALHWERRRQWLELSLTEHREDWGRPLLEAWSASLPSRGDPGRGPAALALGLVALRLADQDPEEGSAYLAGPPMRSLDAVVENALEAAARERFALRDEAMVRLATIAESEGDTLLALAWSDSLLAAHPESPHAPEAIAVRARSRLVAGDYAAAITLANRGLEQTPTPELRWILARAKAGAGRKVEAAADLEALINATPGDPLAAEAWRMRTALEETVPLDAGDRVALLGVLLSNPSSGAEDALRVLETASELSEGRRVDATLALARYQYRRKQYDDALTRAKALAGTAGAAGEARLIEARIYRNTGRLQPMEATYRLLMTSRSGEGATAAWELAKEWESRSQWQKAAKAYTELLTKFPGSPRERDATFRRGFSRLMQGKKQDALSDFRAAHRLSRTPAEKEQAAYWVAGTLWNLGRRRDAVVFARRAARADEPADAYGVLLRNRFGVPENNRPSPEYTADQREDFEAMCWSCDAVRAVLPPDLRTSYRAGLARLDLGLKRAVRRDWRRAIASSKPGARDLQLFALTASAYDLYPEATEWAKKAMNGAWLSDAERIALRRVSYPAAHGGLVLTEAARHRLDPAWIWALMRQESHYDPEAVSRVGALGLMQIMPATLGEMTAESGMASLPPEVLFRPNTNIAFGTRYFAERLAEFDGHLFPTLASYNAGETKSREWIERAKGDTQEVFLECIGYPETYDYVRRIVWNTWLYHHLYSEGNGIG